MIYSLNSPYLYGMMDDYITGGDDPYGDDSPNRCRCCDRIIREDEESSGGYCINCAEMGY
ncbi:MAG: hypothetical protein J1G06_09865 [Oscillospiraceae bacterium]|nr:hypothetical protein [Oscillospiraceae bacterium]